MSSILPEGVLQERNNATVYAKGTLQQGAILSSEEKAALDGGRLMLIDGTSIIYRAYYKLLGMLYGYFTLLVYIDWLSFKF